MDKIVRKSFVFYESFFNSIEKLDRNVQADVLLALVRYALRGETDPNLKPITNALFLSFKPQIDMNNQRYLNGVKGGEYGQKGGRPKTPKKPQKNPIKTPNVNDNVNDNDTVNDNTKIKKNTKKGTHSRASGQDIFFNPAKDAWFEYHPDFNFDASEGSALKSLVKKIIKSVKEKTPEADMTPEVLKTSFSVLLQCLPDWYKSQNLKVINSKYDTLISEIKNKKNGQQARSDIFKTSKYAPR